MSNTDKLEKELKKQYPDGFVLLHKHGRVVSIKLSELSWWIGYWLQVTRDEVASLYEELKDLEQ